MPPAKLPSRLVMALVIGMGGAAGGYIAGEAWPVMAIVGVAAAAVVWVAFPKVGR